MKKGLIVAALFISTEAKAVGYDCPTIKAYVAQYGIQAVIAWAFKNGYTLGQIRAVQRSCSGR